MVFKIWKKLGSDKALAEVFPTSYMGRVTSYFFRISIEFYWPSKNVHEKILLFIETWKFYDRIRKALAICGLSFKVLLWVVFELQPREHGPNRWGFFIFFLWENSESMQKFTHECVNNEHVTCMSGAWHAWHACKFERNFSI